MIGADPWDLSMTAWVNNFNYCKGFTSTFVIGSSFSLFVIIAEVDSWSILHLNLLDYAKMQAMAIFRFGVIY